MLNLLKDFAARKQQAGRLYDGLVRRAREPVFFTRFGVADSLDGRFDMLAFHAWLVLTELKGSAVAQDLTTAGLTPSADLLDGLLAEAAEHAERRALEEAQREVVDHLGVPVYELERIAGGIDLGGLYELAAALQRQGMA